MNKTLRFLLVVLIAIAAMAYAVHSIHVGGLVRSLHGGA
jgi:hypothetical protein